MLHVEALPAGLLPILKRLMELPTLCDHALVGGTALALRYGHRMSVDIDLFTTGSMETGPLIESLREEFDIRFTYRRDQQAKWAIFGRIDHIKLDIVRFPHGRIDEIVIEEGIRSYSDQDIAPMKIEAILHRGKKKDFFDMDVLLRNHGMVKILEYHRHKYPDQGIAISIPRALTYFADAEDSEDPVSLQGQTWEGVKDSISNYVSDYLR
jgi:hypothetical protein